MKRSTPLRRHSPLRSKRRPSSDKVTPELRTAVLFRDGGCVAWVIGANDLCRDRWGTPVRHEDLAAMTLDHVRDEACMAKRAPSDLAHLVTLCWHHHLDGWATSHRPALRAYLREAEA